jgi:hypothetical protein
VEGENGKRIQTCTYFWALKTGWFYVEQSREPREALKEKTQECTPQAK